MRLLHLQIFNELGSHEMGNTVLADPLYDCKREKVRDKNVFLVFGINLPRHVAVVLYDSLCRMKLSSCKSYK